MKKSNVNNVIFLAKLAKTQQFAKLVIQNSLLNQKVFVFQYARKRNIKMKIKNAKIAISLVKLVIIQKVAVLAIQNSLYHLMIYAQINAIKKDIF